MSFSLKNSITQTFNYAKHFDYHLDLEELHRWLITPRRISRSSLLKSLTKNQLQFLSHPPASKKSRYALSSHKKLLAKRFVTLISLIPTVKLVAITGSVSVNNAHRSDDIDLMIVTTPHTLWLTRPLITILLFLFFKKRSPKATSKQAINNAFCLNLWLDTTTLAVPEFKRNLYIAHEVLQIHPLLNRDFTYQHFLLTNSWAKIYLANAFKTSSNLPKLKRSSFLSHIFLPFNFLFYLLQYFYMKSKITREYITPHAAYFHPHQPFPSTSGHKSHSKLQ